jgi:hypothetical protein
MAEIKTVLTQLQTAHRSASPDAAKLTPLLKQAKVGHYYNHIA